MSGFTTEVRDGVSVVHLRGAADPAALLDRLERVRRSGPLVVDLTGLGAVDTPEERELVLRLEAGPGRAVTALVHAELAVRQRLRSAGRGLPVLPDVDKALEARPVASSPRPATRSVGRRSGTPS